MTDLFKDRPTDKDTSVLRSRQAEISGLNVLLEEWNWEGVSGQSAVLLSSQVTGLSNDEIITRLREDITITGATTVTRTENGFVFINYGFNST